MRKLVNQITLNLESLRKELSQLTDSEILTIANELI